MWNALVILNCLLKQITSINLSVSKIIEHGYKVNFNKSGTEIFHVDSKLVAEAFHYNSIYQMSTVSNTLL